jgi:hypothetical protein
VEINSKNFTIPLHTSVYIDGDAISVEVSMGGEEGAKTICSIDSLLQEYLDLHEFWEGGGHSPEALAGLLILRKRIDHYIRKLKATPKGSAASRTRGSRPSARGK